MSVVKRQDGVHFVVRPYRESLTHKKRAVLKKEVDYLHRHHGQYVCFLLHDDCIEAIFSHEPGYLLGESVNDYFDESKNFIYCEHLAHDNLFLLVVVVDNRVYLDACVTATELAEELAVLQGLNRLVDVFVTANVPISVIQSEDAGQADGIALYAEQVSKYHLLEQSIFARLMPDDNFKLMLFEQAWLLKPLGYASPIWLFLFIFALGAGSLAAIYWTQAAPDKIDETPQAHTRYDYRELLNSPMPSSQAEFITHQLNALLSMPGWSVQKISYRGPKLVTELLSVGGGIHTVKTWADHYNAQYQLMTNGVKVELTHVLPNRHLPAEINKVENTVAKLTQRLALLVVNANPQLMSNRLVGVYREVRLSVTLNDISAETLELVGEAIDDLPLVIDSLNGQVHDGLFSGNLELTILGS